MAKVGRPRIIESPEEFEQRADDYFAECQQSGEPVTITGLALALGFAAVQSLHDYEARPEFSDSVKRARLYVQNQVEKQLFTNKPTGPIFWLKSQANWADKHELEVSGANGGALEVSVIHEVIDPVEN